MHDGTIPDPEAHALDGVQTSIRARAAAMEVLVQALEHPGRHVAFVAAALELCGFTVGVCFVDDKEGGKVDPHRMNVHGAHAIGWQIARESTGVGFYGRPLSGPHPWHFGEGAPRGRKLAGHLFALLEAPGGAG